MLYCSLRVLDSTLIETVLPIINDENFALEYLQQIDEDELTGLIKSVGFQNKRVRDVKKAIQQIADDFGGKIPDTEDQIWKIHGVRQKIGLLILEEVFNKVEVSLFLFCYLNLEFFPIVTQLIVIDFCRVFRLTFM